MSQKTKPGKICYISESAESSPTERGGDGNGKNIHETDFLLHYFIK